MRVGDFDGFGRFGRVESDEQGRLLCHECGAWWKHLATHVKGAHGIHPREYRERHGLAPSQRLVGAQVREALTVAYAAHRDEHLAALDRSRDIQAAATASRPGNRRISPQTRQARSDRARAWRGRDLTTAEVASLADVEHDMQAWCDRARELLALAEVSSSSIARAIDLQPVSVQQRLRRWPSGGSRAGVTHRADRDASRALDTEGGSWSGPDAAGLPAAWLSRAEAAGEYLRSTGQVPTREHHHLALAVLGRWLHTQRTQLAAPATQQDHAKRLYLDQTVPGWEKEPGHLPRDVTRVIVRTKRSRRPGAGPAREAKVDRSAQWRAKADAVGQYLRVTGRFPSARSSDPHVRSLGVWLATQVGRSRGKGGLGAPWTPEYAAYLDKVAPGWATRTRGPDRPSDGLTAAWLATADAVARHRRETGRFPSTRDPDPGVRSLGDWLRGQVAASRGTKGAEGRVWTPERAAYLGEILPGWDDRPVGKPGRRTTQTRAAQEQEIAQEQEAAQKRKAAWHDRRAAREREIVQEREAVQERRAARVARSAERAVRMTEMRAQGKNWSQIAQVLGISRSAVRQFARQWRIT